MSGFATGTWHCRIATCLGYPSKDDPLFRTSAGSADPLAQIDYAAGLGLAGVDDPFFLRREPDEQVRMGRALERTRLEFGSVALAAGQAREPLWGQGSDDARDEIDRRLAIAFEALQRVGGRRITLITGFEPLVPRYVQYGALIDNLRRVVPQLEKAGVTLYVEPTSDLRIPNLLVNELGDGYLVCKAVDSPNVQLVFDTVHVQLAHGNLIENLHAVWDTIGYIQLADNPGRIEPGAGEINFVSFIEAALNLGYRGMFALEHGLSVEGQAGEAAALAYLRAIDAAVAQRYAG